MDFSTELLVLVTFYKIQITQLLLVLVVALDLIHQLMVQVVQEMTPLLHMRVENSVQQVVVVAVEHQQPRQDLMQMDLLEDLVVVPVVRQVEAGGADDTFPSEQQLQHL